MKETNEWVLMDIKRLVIVSVLKYYAILKKPLFPFNAKAMLLLIM